MAGFRGMKYENSRSKAACVNAGDEHRESLPSQQTMNALPAHAKYCGVTTRGHLFKDCPQWKSQQKALWAVVREETGRSEDRFKISECFADERCSKAILDFLETTEVGRTAGPPVAGEEPGREGLGVGKERMQGIPCTGGRGREGAGRGGGRLGIIDYLFFLFFLFITCQPPKGGGGGARRPHRDGDLRRIRGCGEKGFV